MDCARRRSVSSSSGITAEAGTLMYSARAPFTLAPSSLLSVHRLCLPSRQCLHWPQPHAACAMTFPKASDAFAELVDDAGKLMTWNDRHFHRLLSLVAGDIRAADTHVFHVNDHFPRSGNRLRHLPHLQFIWFYQNCSFHFATSFLTQFTLTVFLIISLLFPLPLRCRDPDIPRRRN